MREGYQRNIHSDGHYFPPLDLSLEWKEDALGFTNKIVLQDC